MRPKRFFLISTAIILCTALLYSWNLKSPGFNGIMPSKAIADTDHEEHLHSSEEASGHGHDHEDEGQGAHMEHEDSAAHDGMVHLSDEEIKEFGLRLEVAAPGILKHCIELPGEIVMNADRTAHVVPRVAGIARRVLKSAGESVREGELLAVIESRELAEAIASYLAAIERERLAKANFLREDRLWKKKITSEQEYLDARQALAEARISRNSVEQQLHAIGLSEDDIKKITARHHEKGTRFEIRSPISGTIIARHLTLGESVSADTNVFTIADLSTVWVDINVYQKDLSLIRQGQPVTISAGHGLPDVKGTIAWISPHVDQATRTAKARIVLPNPDGRMRPGLFVTARVAAGSDEAGVVVPEEAILTFEGARVIFVRTPDGFRPVRVTEGRRDGTNVEITSGIEHGQIYVAKGAFTLKAQLSKGAFGDGHNH